jgi:GntR family transcriptional regulator
MAMDEPLISVDPGLETPPYQQIFEQIRAAIERGEMGADSALPTVRQLAGDLGVAPNTVARAYADLQSAGWLISEGRRGTRVAARLPINQHTRTNALAEAVLRFVQSMCHRGYTQAEILDALDRTVPRG